MNHIFYQTKTKYSNTGDALINSALINALRAYGTLHANYGKNIPTDFLDALGIRDEERVLCDSELQFVKTVVGCAMKAARNGDRVYIFSGLGDMHGGGTRLVLRNFASGLVFPVFRLFGVQIVRIGRSVGPISKLMAVSEFIRGLFLSHYYVRDTKSLERCHKMGIKKTKFCPDMSWIYDKEHAEKVNHTNVVMVNLRDRIFDDADEVFAETTLNKCEELLGLMRKELGEDMKICVAYQIVEDREFSERVYQRLKQKYDVEYIDHQMTLEELENYYGAVDYHISNRMHSLLAGYKYGSLPIALIDVEKHVKISATFHDCDLGGLLVDVYAPLNKEQITQLNTERECLLAGLYGCEKVNQQKIIDALDYIFG